MKTPPPRSVLDKYGLFDMKIGGHKDFALKLYDKVRMSAQYYRKRYDRLYPTRKIKSGTKTIVRVFREK